MNITYLIGNGFDINLGLETGYRDFLKQYRIVEESDSETFRFFKKSIRDNSDLWKDAELGMGAITQAFYDNRMGQEEFENCYTDFTLKLAAYLREQENELDEVAFQDNASWIGTFAKDIMSFTNGLTEDKRRMIEAHVSMISGGYNISFLNFNYTNTLDRFIKYSAVRKALGTRFYKGSYQENVFDSICHVHGTVEAEMVFGVDSVEQIKQPKIITNDLFSKLFIKETANVLFEERTEEKAKQIINSSDLILIYGMSIGETDRRWWNRICELLLNRKLYVIIYDYSMPDEGLQKIQYLRYREDAVNHFVGYYDLKIDNISKMKERIIVCRANPFSSIKELAPKSRESRLREAYKKRTINSLDAPSL